MKISLRWSAHSVAAAKIVPLLVPGTACLSLAAPTRAQESDSIYGCDHKDFDAVSMQTAKDGTETVVEGEVNILNYGLPPDAGELAVYRNVRTALAGAGYGFLFEQSPSTLVARKGSQFIQVQTGGGAYTLNMVKQQAMEQVVTADPTLQQVIKLMQQNPLLKVRVEGHTDNVGKRDANQALSEKRAVAVVDWLTAQGFADSKPLTNNGTEEGRAKNRRVELVKIP